MNRIIKIGMDVHSKITLYVQWNLLSGQKTGSLGRYRSPRTTKLVQQIAIVYKLAAVIAPACFHTTRRQEIGLARTGDAVDPHILPVFSEVEFQDLLNRGIIIDAPVAGFQIFGLCAFIDQAAEPQIGFKSRIKGRYVLWLQYLAKKL